MKSHKTRSDSWSISGPKPSALVACALKLMTSNEGTARRCLKPQKASSDVVDPNDCATGSHHFHFSSPRGTLPRHDDEDLSTKRKLLRQATTNSL